MIHPVRHPAAAIVLIILLFLLPVSVKSQHGTGLPFGHSFLFNTNMTETRNMVRQPVYFQIPDTAISTIFDELGNGKKNSSSSTPTSPALLGVKLSPNLTYYHSAIVSSITKDYYSFLIQDSSDAVLVAMGITDYNYHDYIYHVVQNDSLELVPWSPVTDLRREYGAKKPFAFIGRFNYPGKWIVVEIRNTKDYSIRDGVVFDWRTNLKPKLEQIIFAVPNDYFNLAYPSINRGYATRFDKATSVPTDLHFPADSVRYITFQFRNEESLVHSVHLIRHVDGRTDTLSLGMIDNHGYFVADKENFNQPGQYAFVFQRQLRYPSWDEAQLLRIPFEVTEPASNTTLTKQVFLAIGITICALLLCFWIYRRSTRRMMQRLAQQKESAQLKLKSVQAQLNPHFIFNALSSIQNLMNKQATSEANHYLARFASLTRATLDSGSQDMISLEQELKIADNYLQMEQLRFGFTYALDMDRSLQPVNIEVPPMLLQPLIENAVKHGIAGREDGMIRLLAKREGQHLLLIIEDNGRGFDPETPANGFGLKLSRERIDLLNSLYNGRPFSMTINTSVKGTLITIILNNWL